MIKNYPNDLLCMLREDVKIFKDPQPNRFIVLSTEDLELPKGTLVKVIDYKEDSTYVVKPVDIDKDIELHNVVHHQLTPDIEATGKLLESLVEKDLQQNLNSYEKDVILFAAEMLKKFGELQSYYEVLRKTCVKMTNLFQKFYI